MKHTFISLIISLFCGIANAGVETVKYYYFNPSKMAVKTIYDGSGDVIGKQEFRVKQVEKNYVEGQNYVIKKGQQPEVNEVAYSVDGGTLLVYMGKNEEGKEVYLDYRSDMNVKGVSITGAEFETTARVAGREMKISCTVSNRTVQRATETVASPVGKWACIKTEYDMELVGKVWGVGIPVNLHVVEWFAPDMGIVRTEVYRRGKLHDTRLLTSFKAV